MKAYPQYFKVLCFDIPMGGWAWAVVLGSFQCRGVLLLLHIVGQGPAVLAAGSRRVGYVFFYIFSSIFHFLCPVFWEMDEHD